MKQIVLKNFNLYDYLSNKILVSFEKKMNLNKIEKEKLRIGILTLIINFIKTLLFLPIAFTLGTLKEAIFIMVVFSSLRLTAAGLHAKNSIICTLTTLLAYIGGIYLSINYPINSIIVFIICIGLTLLLYKYSPADTENRPILGSKKRKKLKMQTLVTALILLIVNLIFWNKKMLNLTMISMLLQTISILPITYKLLKRSCNNYEKYEK